MTNSRKRRTDNQRYYNAKRPKILADRKAAYNEVPETKKLASCDSYKKNAKRIKKAAKTCYQKDPQSKKQAARVWSKANYAMNAEHKKQAARVWSKTNYAVNAEHKKQAAFYFVDLFGSKSCSFFDPFCIFFVAIARSKLFRGMVNKPAMRSAKILGLFA